MPFNIELSRSEPFIKLQISKNTITLYFYGADNETIAAALNAWDHLDGHFLSSIPEYNAHWFRGPDLPHIKRNHTNSGETDRAHFHREFTTEVTPDLLALYLTNVWKQQNDSHHDSAVFKFFKDGEIDNILKIFSLYYKEYKGSSVEGDFERETTLTVEEDTSYRNALKEDRDAHKLLAMLSMFTLGRTPSLSTSIDALEFEETCSIM